MRRIYRRFFLAVLALYIFGSEASTASAQTWIQIGPDPDQQNYVKLLRIDPATPSTLYAGLVYENYYHEGGVFKSIDGGHTWTAPGPGMPTNPDIYALAIDPLTPSTLYAANRRDGVYKSVNGGGSWNRMSPSVGDVDIRSIAIDPKTTSTVYVGMDGGLYKSMDGGANWSSSSTGMPANPTVNAIAIDPNNPSTLYVGLPNGVYKSIDGGANWSPANAGISAADIFSLAIHPTTPSILYAGTDMLSGATASRVYVSTNSGNTWSDMSTGLPMGAGVHDLEIDPMTPSTVYAALFDSSMGGVYKSTDSGATWNAIGTGLSDLFDHTIAIPPASPANIYVGTCNRGVSVLSSGSTTLTSLSPNSAASGGAAFTLTVNGSNFINGATVYWGATALSTTFVSVTQLKASVPASLITSVGTANVTVTTAVDTSGALTFTISLMEVPAVTGITPPSGTTGTSLPATISGTNLTGATAVTFSGSGVTATIGTGVTATSLPVTITITAGAATDTRTVTVAASGGTSAPFPGFAVTAPTGPAITGISPPSGTAGTSLPTTISGTNLTGATAVTFSGSGVTATIGTGGTATSLPIMVTIAANASTDTRTVIVTAAGGTSAPFAGFAVIAPGVPAITGITPPSGTPRTSLPATISGTNLTGATAVTFSGSGVTATIGTGGTATSVPITVTIAAGASAYTRTVTVTAAGGTSAPFTGFAVTAPGVPAITGITPPSGTTGTSLPATISGTNLTGATAVTFSGSGVTATIGTGGTATSLPVTVTIAAGASTYTRTVAVTTGNGTSAPFTGFTVTAAAVLPIINDFTVTPPGLSQSLAPLFGGGFTLSVNGKNFDQGTQLRWGATALNTSFVSTTQLTAIVPAAQLTVPGAVTLTAVSSSGTSNSVVAKVIERADINADRSVSISDALLCALIAGGLNKPALPLTVGDLNLSSSANIGDCLALAVFSVGANANLTTPSVNTLFPNTPNRGDVLTITGTGFSTFAANNKVVFPTTGGGVTVVTASDATATTLIVTTPPDAVSGGILVYRQDVPLMGGAFPLTINGIAPPLALMQVSPFFNMSRGTSVTLTGMGFSSDPTSNIVLFSSATGTTRAIVTGANPGSLTATVPTDAVCGPVTVSVGSQTSEARIVTVQGTSCGLQVVSTFGNPSPGGTLVLEGSGFDAVVPGNNIVKFQAAGGGTVNATVFNAGRTQLQVHVPETAVAGNITLSVGGTVSNPVPFVPSLPTAPLSVDVVVNSPDAVGAYQVTIGFDKNIVTVNTANVKGGTGAGFTGPPTTINVDNNAGTVTINQFQTGSAPAGSFTVANLVFTPVAVGTSQLTLSGITLADTNGYDLPASRIVLSRDSITVLSVP